MEDNTQFENDFAAEETAEVVEVTFAETFDTVPAENVPGEHTEEDDFFAENAAPEVPAVDPATVVTVRTSAGQSAYVQIDAPMPLVDVIARSGIRFAGDFTAWLNGAEVRLDTVIPQGSTVTVVGSVKGG